MYRCFALLYFIESIVEASSPTYKRLHTHTALITQHKSSKLFDSDDFAIKACTRDWLSDHRHWSEWTNLLLLCSFPAQSVKINHPRTQSCTAIRREKSPTLPLHNCAVPPSCWSSRRGAFYLRVRGGQCLLPVLPVQANSRNYHRGEGRTFWCFLPWKTQRCDNATRLLPDSLDWVEVWLHKKPARWSNLNNLSSSALPSRLNSSRSTLRCSMRTNSWHYGIQRSERQDCDNRSQM